MTLADRQTDRQTERERERVIMVSISISITKPTIIKECSQISAYLCLLWSGKVDVHSHV